MADDGVPTPKKKNLQVRMNGRKAAEHQQILLHPYLEESFYQNVLGNFLELALVCKESLGFNDSGMSIFILSDEFKID